MTEDIARTSKLVWLNKRKSKVRPQSSGGGAGSVGVLVLRAPSVFMPQGAPTILHLIFYFMKISWYLDIVLKSLCQIDWKTLNWTWRKYKTFCDIFVVACVGALHSSCKTSTWFIIKIIVVMWLWLALKQNTATNKRSIVHNREMKTSIHLFVGETIVIRENGPTVRNL